MITAAQAAYLKAVEAHDALVAEDQRLMRAAMSCQMRVKSLRGPVREQVLQEMNKHMQARTALLPKLQKAALERESANYACWNEKKQMEMGIPPVPAPPPAAQPPLINEAQWQHIEQLARALRNEDLRALAKVRVATEFLNVTMPILKKVVGGAR